MENNPERVTEIVCDSLESAIHDAVMMGMGGLVLRPDLTMEHIPPERYLEMAEALVWATKEYKELPKQ